MNALNRKLIRDVMHLRGQVVAVALVVACGIAAFVAMRSTYYSLLDSQAAYYQQYRFADVFAQIKRAPETLSRKIADIPGVASAQTRVVANVTLDVPGVAEPARGRVLSLPEQRVPLLNDLHLLRGRYLEPGQRDEIIISGAFSAANNLQPGDSLSAILNGRWQRLRIVGVALSPEYIYEIGGGEMFPDSHRFGVIWMSRTALAALFDMEGAFNDVSLTLAPGASESQVIERLDNLLDEYGGLGAYGREDQTSHNFVTNEIAELSVTSTFVPGVFLGVTAFLLHLVLSRLVATQRDQIAVLKAFGYGNLIIGWHYWLLSLVAVLGGIVLGLAGGWWFGRAMTGLYADFFRFPVLRYAPEAKVILTAVLISFLAASIGALAAVYRAVKLPPAEAMRPEAPARFRAGWIERLGLAYVLSPATRIIVRNLARRPFKAMLTTCGISLSVALLVTGFFLYQDAINRVMDVMFNAVYRQDLSVIFNQPLSARARYDIAHLPGVWHVEANRFVAVRLRYGPRARRLGLAGLEQGAQLWRIVDSDYHIYDLPPDGLVLTAKLAERLGVKPGDVLTVEVLEEARTKHQVPVVATVNDLVGLSAYMEINALNRLLREGGTVSNLHLQADERFLPALYAQLKQTPAVRGVIVPGALLENFKQTLARTMGTTTATMIFFACVIALGVVYNSARIALSERGRELASLRVLGFTQREVALMLIGEQAILILLALPLGWALGWALAWLIINAVDNELMRLPLNMSAQTLARASLIIVAAAGLSALLVVRRLRRLDLVEVLKTRE